MRVRALLIGCMTILGPLSLASAKTFPISDDQVLEDARKIFHEELEGLYEVRAIEVVRRERSRIAPGGFHRPYVEGTCRAVRNSNGLEELPAGSERARRDPFFYLHRRPEGYGFSGTLRLH